MRHCTARALELLLTLPLFAPGPLSGLQSTVPVIRAPPQALTRSVSETAGSLFDAMEPIASRDVLEEHLKRAIELEPRSILFYLDLGETYLLQEKDDLARETFEAGLALPNTYPPDDVFKGQIRRMLDRIEAAGTR